MEIKLNSRWRRRTPPKKAFTVVDIFSDLSNCRVVWDDGAQGYLMPDDIEDMCEPAPPKESQETSEAESSWMEPDDLHPPEISVRADIAARNGHVVAQPMMLEHSSGDNARVAQILVVLRGLKISDALRVLAEVREAIFDQPIAER